MFTRTAQLPIPISTGFPITQSVLDGKQEGAVYITGADFFVLHKAGFSSLLRNSDDIATFLSFCKEEDVPQYFHVYDANPSIIKGFLAKPNIFKCKVRRRCILRYEYAERIPYIVPKGYSLLEVDHSNFDMLSSFSINLPNKFWNGEDDFIKKSKGVFLVDKQNKAASLCYSAATAGGLAEIDVLTTPEQRGRGLAKVVVSAFVSHCIQSEIIPNWDCFQENIPSLRTALGLNFLKKYSYDFLSIYKLKV